MCASDLRLLFAAHVRCVLAATIGRLQIIAMS